MNKQKYAVIDKSIIDLVVYDAESPTGLAWKIDVGCRGKAGNKAGSLGARGYYQVLHGRKMYRNNRLVWELHHGDIPEDLIVDHIDGDKTNNRIENLRLASKAQNGQNKPSCKPNKYGVKGMTFDARRATWKGSIRANNVVYAKSSKSFDVVKNWLIDKRKELHGEFAHHG